jgi:TPR repeat protein
VKWYRLAAKQGYASAQSNLGLMYDDGQGVPQDYQEAVKWYRRAAAQGYAQFNLGVSYELGHGVPQDFIRALMWYSVAAAVLGSQMRKDAVERRDDVVARMTAAQIAKAQEMARRCQDTKFKECD